MVEDPFARLTGRVPKLYISVVSQAVFKLFDCAWSFTFQSCRLVLSRAPSFNQLSSAHRYAGGEDYFNNIGALCELAGAKCMLNERPGKLTGAS